MNSLFSLCYHLIPFDLFSPTPPSRHCISMLAEYKSNLVSWTSELGTRPGMATDGAFANTLAAHNPTLSIQPFCGNWSRATGSTFQGVYATGHRFISSSEKPQYSLQRSTECEEIIVSGSLKLHISQRDSQSKSRQGSQSTLKNENYCWHDLFFPRNADAVPHNWILLLLLHLTGASETPLSKHVTDTYLR